MKVFLIGMAMFVLNVFFLTFQDDHNRLERYDITLKYITEEAAAAAAQYYDKVKYSEGQIVFDQTEGIKAAEYIIKTNLKLDNSFMPTANSYWQDKVTYTIQFYDDSNTTYPYLYTHSSGYFTLAIGDPTVVITINVGKPRARLLYSNPPDFFRTAAHTWTERGK